MAFVIFDGLYKGQAGTNLFMIGAVTPVAFNPWIASVSIQESSDSDWRVRIIENGNHFNVVGTIKSVFKDFQKAKRYVGEAGFILSTPPDTKALQAEVKATAERGGEGSRKSAELQLSAYLKSSQEWRKQYDLG